MISIQVKHHFPGRIRFKASALRHHKDVGTWIETSLMAIQGISAVRVNESAQSVVVEYDTQLLQAKTVEERLSQLDLAEATQEEAEHKFTRGDIAMNVIGTIAAALLPNKWGALSTATLIAPTLFEGVSDLKDKNISVEVLDAIAVGLSAWRGDYRTAMMTQSLISLGEYMEQKTSRNSDQLLADLMRPQESIVWRVDGTQRTQVNSTELDVGDVIELAPGVSIPVDGTIIKGAALINQSSLTGENVPVRREESAVVYSGTSVHEGTIQVRVDKVGSEATTAKIAKLIYDSLSEKSEIQQVTQDMANRRVKITLGIGAAVFALTQDINRVASVFLVDYSCALKLSTPVTFKSIMYRAAQQGILFKGGSAIEKLVKIDTCVFDKTGTLTHGDMQVTDVIPLCDSNTARDLLAIAASVEEHSNHPLSQAVVNAAKHNQLPHIEHGEVEYVIAHGLKSTMNDHELVMGSRHFLEVHESVDFTPFEDVIKKYEAQGRHLIFISHQNVLIGMIGLRDHLREDALDTLNALHQFGVKELIMITGDSQFKASILADELKLDRVFAEAVPSEKSTIVEALQAEGRTVMFVGDGVNDAPALTAADVGVAMGRGTELARQVADVVLLRDQLYGLAEARELANIAMHVINSNIKIAEYVNSGIMLAAALGWLNPTMSALLHNGTTLSILGRSAALRHG
ncbi:MULTISPECIES: heavy metal translocating P-type ATPase [Vibrio]|jgi:heavy metal translocating P-type ATPase|uniref:P-type Zn(2+) transporter n=2 Tax=Vibrio harveyi TaxID=669 RepID=A0ABM5XV09_VIBHA|nr:MULTISPECIES: heavy metal translocating P-type ATPase [Vibrio]AMF96904.1 heavy metal translocating P-type ATPase [Vibrio harveyi]EKM13839.1 cadmium-translocating P-type ATPase [Vibrio harveyi]EKO3799978.1 heavy metal translocating P-type ATPase [Vibrio harveyi]EKO3804557.1 heavy metal translocating P-type ATPase [Vibrio harveyi]EKO3809204.1 heavy metal translocating P-type ATPase [Vibrio harveyi]